MVFLLNILLVIKFALLSLEFDQNLLSISHTERQIYISFNQVLTKNHNFFEKDLVSRLITCVSAQTHSKMWIIPPDPYRVKLSSNADPQTKKKSNVYTTFLPSLKTLVISASTKHYKDSTFFCTFIIKGLL